MARSRSKVAADGDIGDALTALAIAGLDERSLILGILLTRLGRLNEIMMSAMQSEMFDAPRQGFGEPWVLVTLLLQGAPFRASPTVLCRTSLLTSGGMTKTLKGLEGEKLVRRVADPEDGRALLVELTAEGQRFARRILKRTSDDYRDLFGDELKNNKQLYPLLRTLLTRFELRQERGDSEPWLRL